MCHDSQTPQSQAFPLSATLQQLFSFPWSTWSHSCGFSHVESLKFDTKSSTLDSEFNTLFYCPQKHFCVISSVFNTEKNPGLCSNSDVPSQAKCVLPSALQFLWTSRKYCSSEMPLYTTLSLSQTPLPFLQVEITLLLISTVKINK